MTLCPVALAVGCKKCPIFSVCPLKSAIGDFKPDVKEQLGSGKTKRKSQRTR
jgi:hypothetical protein